MHIFRIGDRFINLTYLVVAERIDPGHDRVRVTMEAGASFDHDGPDALRLFDRLDLLADNPFPPSMTTIVSRPKEASAGDSSAGPVLEAGA